jgi:hypothetical protein
MGKVELRPAYTWTCDECGRDQFERGFVFDTSVADDHEIQTLCDKADISREEYEAICNAEGEGGMFMMSPKSVTCSACLAKFEVEQFYG